MKALVVYYSRTGTTRKLAEFIAQRCGAQIAEIKCPSIKNSWWSYFWSGRNSLRQDTAAVELNVDLDAYDCVIVGGPVWTGYPCIPIRSILVERTIAAPKVGIFLTSGSKPPQDKAMDEISSLLRRQPDAHLAVQEVVVQGGGFDEQVDGFLAELGLPIRQDG